MTERLLRLEFALLLGAAAGAGATALGLLARGYAPDPAATAWMAGLVAIGGGFSELLRGAHDRALRSWALLLVLLLGAVPGCWVGGPAGALVGGLALLHVAATSEHLEGIVGLLVLAYLPILGVFALCVAFYRVPEPQLVLAGALLAGLHRVLFGTCSPGVCGAYVAALTGNWMLFWILVGLRILARLASW